VTIVSIFFVITSTITLVLSTIEGLKTVVQIPISNGNYSNGTNTSAFGSKTELVDHPIFEFIEIVCIAWFTLEYVLRIWSSPHRWQSFKSPLNIIDFISIVPFYLSIIIDHSSAGDASETDSARKIFTLFRILRVLRIFKLARHSKGLKAFGQTIEKSSDEFGLLFFFLSIQVLLFSSLVYFAEREEDGTQFTSIPATSWYFVVFFRIQNCNILKLKALFFF
jgi:potassium voltage-gated channel Shab-related subfamily B protein 1